MKLISLKISLKTSFSKVAQDCSIWVSQEVLGRLLFRDTHMALNVIVMFSEAWDTFVHQTVRFRDL